MQIRLSTKYLAGNGFVFRSRQHILTCSTRMMNPQLLHCESFAQRKDWRRKKPRRNGEFGGSSTKCRSSLKSCTTFPALQEKHALPVVTFKQDGAPPHTACDMKTLLLESFSDDRVKSRGCKIQWTSRSPELNPTDFWLWGYLKSRVYRCSPTTLVELKNAIRLTVAGIDGDMLYSAVMDAVMPLTCLLSCGGGNVEHLILLKKNP